MTASKRTGTAFIGALVLFCLSFSALANSNMKTVALEKAALRSKPSYLSKTVGTLSYGDQCRAVRKSGDWFEVSLRGKKGWLHKSAFGNRKSILKDIGQGAEVAKNSYKDEVVAAGKGFSPEFEKMYQNQNRNLNYHDVDVMEGYQIAPKFIINFARKGGLAGAAIKGAEK